MDMNASIAELVGVIATIDPQTVANTEKFTDVVDMAKYPQALFAFALGDMAAETIDAKVYTCESDGSGAAALKSATQLSAHASNNDNKQILIAVRGTDLLDSGKRYVKGGMVTGGATGGAAACVVLGFSRADPVTDVDLASVAEIKM